MSADLKDMINLNGQVAIVTGAGAGIGRAIAETFAKAGGGAVLNIGSMAGENKNQRMTSDAAALFTGSEMKAGPANHSV